MKYRLEFLKADILDELEKIGRLEAQFVEVESRIDLPPEEVSFYDRGAIGYLLHNFYNDCENVFRAVARFFENDFGPQSWHKDILKRMKLEIPGYRPRVIDDELFMLLDDFRGFRHKFRHSYGFELDWEKERAVARRLPRTAALFRSRMGAFLDELERMEAE